MLATTLIFLVVLAVLIFVHELGHFLVARACGIRVDAFALGFGPKLWSYKKGETTYSLNLVPFGGYVKIFGENPDDESMTGSDSARSFVNKPKWQQALVLVSGVLFNFLFAWLIVSAVFMTGVPASVDSYPEYASRMAAPRIVVVSVEPASPAEKAGLKEGDVILGATSLEDFSAKVNKSGDAGIDVEYSRGNVEHHSTIVATKGIVEGKYAIGVSMDSVSTLQLPFFLSLYEGGRFTLYTIKTIAAGLYDLLAGIFHGTASLSAVSGPVGIAGMVGNAAQLGFSYLLMFTALISINLGVLNLVPFPALDGGRVLFVLIEAIIRRPIKPVIANTVNTVGFCLLILLMIVVTYRDIARIFIK